MLDPENIARAIHEARCGDSLNMVGFDDLDGCEDGSYLDALRRDAEAVTEYLSGLTLTGPDALARPPMIHIQLADNGNIRKWARGPFEGSAPYRLADCRPDGRGLDDGPPNSIPRKEIQRWRDPAIKARHDAGASLRFIADEFGLSYEGARAALKRMEAQS